MGTLKEMGWGGFSAQLWERAREKCVPIQGTFELTPLCNFRCRMCYVRLDADDLPRHGRLHRADEWLDLARQAMEMGTYHITLTGGEALTHPDFEKIYTGLIEMGLLVTVLSNGSLITADAVRLFQTYRPRRLRFTLYGASNDTYARLCGAPDGFDRVMRGLHLLKDGGVPFSLAFTETTENVDDLDAVLDIAEGLGVGVVVSANLVSAVRGAKSEAAQLRVRVADAPRISRNIDNYRKDSAISEIMDRRVLQEKDSLFAHCRVYRTSFWVDWNGAMEACSYMSSNVARPFDQGFKDAWNRLLEKNAALRLPDKCRLCHALSACPVCPGIREAETGFPDGVPQHLCEEVCTWRLSPSVSMHHEEVRCNEESVCHP